jgi:hypothetical protein
MHRLRKAAIGDHDDKELHKKSRNWRQISRSSRVRTFGGAIPKSCEEAIVMYIDGWR